LNIPNSSSSATVLLTAAYKIMYMHLAANARIMETNVKKESTYRHRRDFNP
jgi:hypothetical protein